MNFTSANITHSRHIKTTGIILRRISLNEADQIINVLTPDQGKVSLVAKGSRRIKSKFCGRLEPFYEVSLNYFQARELGHLDEAEIIRVWPALEMDLRSKAVLFYMAEASMKLLAEGQDAADIYDLLRESLDGFEESRSEIILYGFMVKLLTGLGFMALWDSCLRSNVKLNLNEPHFLSMSDVGIVRSGYAEPADLRLTPSVIKWVSYMQKEPFEKLKMVRPSTGEKAEVWAVMQQVFGNILNLPLRSQSFLMRTS